MYVLGGKVLVLSALARAMNRNGYKVHVSHVSRVLKGERVATKDFITALAAVIGTSYKEAEKVVKRAQAASQDFAQMPKLVEEEG